MNNNVEVIKEILKDYLTSINLQDKEVIVEKPKTTKHGHLSTNLAFLLAKELKDSPVNIANKIVEFIANHPLKCFDNVEIVNPGFINFTFKAEHLYKILHNILQLKDDYGRSAPKHYKYNLELVSANPTGYLHIGHARNGAIGDSVARILRFAGYEVVTEYYTNDAGNQINILAVTVFVHYLNMLGIEAELPSDCYKGEFYEDVAQQFIDEYGDKFKTIKYDERKILDDEVHQLFRWKSVELFMNIIKKQLKRFRVDIEYYISEQSMYDNKRIEATLEKYRELGALYEKDGATWLKTSDYGDDKDRVLIKSDGTYTYITPDLASHVEKYERTKADKIVNFWGGDHHSYVIRMQAGLSLLGLPKGLLEIDMIQMVRLVKNGEEFKMSKRKGTAVWLVDILDLIGVDATRYMLSSKAPSSHMDFDIGALQEHSAKNPVYYAQYATARCNSILNQAKSLNISFDDVSSFDLLKDEKELNILNELDMFNRQVELAANARHPHIICDYIQSIARLFHSYYNEHKIVDLNNIELSKQRLILIKSIYQVLKNAFSLIGIDVVNKM